MSKKNKPNRDVNVLASVHLMLQHEFIHGRVGFKRSDFANWLGISKPTASIVLEACVDKGYFIRYEEIMRSGASVYSYYTNKDFDFTAKGLKQSAFDAYCAVRSYVVGDKWKLW